ncbi:MAG: DUF551 domain-containing protein [Sphaerochaetaceae bacterium]|nr:DUF551 domain-containing protein [Sphaerochaetaceae bacterium]
MTEWKTIDTAPKEEKDILVTDGENISIGSYVAYKDAFYPSHHDKSNNSWWNITHWMPLPEPPAKN